MACLLHIIHIVWRLQKIGVNREEGHGGGGGLKLTKSVEKVHELDPRVKYYQ